MEMTICILLHFAWGIVCLCLCSSTGMSYIRTKCSYFLFANNDIIGYERIPSAIFFNYHVITKLKCISAALPIATVRLQTGLVPAGPIANIAGLAENPARSGETRPDWHKIRQGLVRSTAQDYQQFPLWTSKIPRLANTFPIIPADKVSRETNSGKFPLSKYRRNHNNFIIFRPT